MKRTTLFACLVLAGLAGTSDTGAVVGTTRAEWEACVARHFGDMGKFDSSVTRSLVVRVVREEEGEWQVTLEESGSNRFFVEVVSATGHSVRQQLAELRARFPEEPTESLCDRLKICTVSMVSGEPVATAAQLLDEAVSDQFPLVSRTALYLHQRIYEVWIRHNANSSRFWLSAPSKSSTDDPVASFASRVVNEYSGFCRSNGEEKARQTPLPADDVNFDCGTGKPPDD